MRLNPSDARDCDHALPRPSEAPATMAHEVLFDALYFTGKIVRGLGGLEKGHIVFFEEMEATL